MTDVDFSRLLEATCMRSAQAGAWSPPMVVERKRGTRSRKYTVCVLGREYAFPPTLPGRPRFQPQRPASVTQYTVRAESPGSPSSVQHTRSASPRPKHTFQQLGSGDAFADAVASTDAVQAEASSPRALATRFIADGGARPNSRGAHWPVLVAVGAMERGRDAAPQQELAAAQSRSKTENIPHSDECIVHTNRAQLQRQPFRAGSPRPRLLERKPGPISEAEAQLQAQPTTVISGNSWLRRASGHATHSPAAAKADKNRIDRAKRREASRKKRDENDREVNFNIGSPEVHHAGVRKEMKAKMKRALSRMKEVHERGIRLAEIRKLRRPTVGFHSRHVVDRDVIRTKDDTSLLQESFDRHFAPMYEFTRSDALEALEDFGIAATSLPHMEELMQSFSFATGTYPCSFEIFRLIAADARRRMRQWWRQDVHRAWREIDVDHANMLPVSQLWSLLVECGVGPLSVHQEELFEVMMEELDKDADGRVRYEEAEHLVQQARETRWAQKRRDERRIREKYHIPTDYFLDFRPLLIEFEEGFRNIDVNRRGELTVDETLELLEAFGLIQECSNANIEHIKVFVEVCVEKIGSGVTFTVLLSILWKLRREFVAASRTSESKTFFMTLPGSQEDGIAAHDVVFFMAHFGLVITGKDEQGVISQVLHELSDPDTDYFDLETSLVAVHRSFEALARLSYKRLLAKAQDIGFDQLMYRQLRNIWQECCQEEEPEHKMFYIGVREVEFALTSLGYSLPQWRIAAFLDSELQYSYADRASSGFVAFMGIMRRVLDELEADERKESGSSADKKDLPMDAGLLMAADP